MSVADKIAALLGAGHNVPAGVADILMDLDKRVAALETKKEPVSKPGDFNELNKST